MAGMSAMVAGWIEKVMVGKVKIFFMFIFVVFYLVRIYGWGYQRLSCCKR